MNIFGRIKRFVGKDKTKRKQSIRARKIALFHFFRPNKPLLSKLSYGFHWYAYNEHMSNQIYVGLHEENEILYLQKTAKPDWVSLDIGANAGFYSLLLNVHCTNGKIYAYEPSEREWNRLQAHMKKNSTQHIVAQKLAVGNTEGEIELYIHEGKNMGMNTTRPEARFNYTHSEKVPLVTVDNECRKLNLQRLDFVKLDVEGLETEVIDGAINTFTTYMPVILCEVWDVMNKPFEEGAKQSGIIMRLQALGYEAWQPNEKGIAEKISNQKIIQHNNILFIHPQRQREFVIG